jgi:membrane associated rhomboid family serine protease
MSSGADLFVVCKQCGSEVSPYITECPYCGHRLRRRAPKLPRAHDAGRASRRRGPLSLLRRRPAPFAALAEGRWALGRPYATIALVAASCAGWIVWHAHPDLYLRMTLFGPIHGSWWKLFTHEFAYLKGAYAFVAIIAIAIFGWLVERRHGPAVVLALFFGAAVTGALLAVAVYPVPWVSGGNAGALALLAAWAAPDIRSLRTGAYYEGDLLGTAAIAAVLAVLPFAIVPPEASWLAGVAGAAVGLLVGLGLQRPARRPL